MNFKMKNEHGIRLYYSDNNKFSILQDDVDKMYYIRILDNDMWYYPKWGNRGFFDIYDAKQFLNNINLNNVTKDYVEIIETEQYKEFKDIMKIFGFEEITVLSDNHIDRYYKAEFKTNDSNELDITCTYHIYDNAMSISITTGTFGENSRYFCNIDKLIIELERLLFKYNVPDIFAQISLISKNTKYDLSSSTDIIGSFYISCAKSARDISKDLVRVKSSNVWGYNIDIKDRHDKFGNVVVQFKDKNGGPGDAYMLYDVPIRLYRRWVSAPSKGHFYHQYLRNNFSYSKLTGDKKGKLSNAIN